MLLGLQNFFWYLRQRNQNSARRIRGSCSFIWMNRSSSSSSSLSLPLSPLLKKQWIIVADQPKPKSELKKNVEDEQKKRNFENPLTKQKSGCGSVRTQLARRPTQRPDVKGSKNPFSVSLMLRWVLACRNVPQETHSHCWHQV